MDGNYDVNARRPQQPAYDSADAGAVGGAYDLGAISAGLDSYDVVADKKNPGMRGAAPRDTSYDVVVDKKGAGAPVRAGPVQDSYDVVVDKKDPVRAAPVQT